MKFDGSQPGPGRPRGSGGGRTRVLLELDRLLAKAANTKRLREALQAEFDADPVAFFRRFVMPLLPRESLVQAEVASTDVKVCHDSDWYGNEARLREIQAVSQELLHHPDYIEWIRQRAFAEQAGHREPGGNGHLKAPVQTDTAESNDNGQA